MTTIDASMRALEIQGTTVPKLGFGTWQIEGPECQEAVEDAVPIGYRHIDTARAYGNEQEVGRGLAAAGSARNEFFLTTKIWREEYAPDDRRRAAEDSLQNLRAARDRRGARQERRAGRAALAARQAAGGARSRRRSSHERRVENFEVFDFGLTDEERDRIEALRKDERIIDPGFGPDWGH